MNKKIVFIISILLLNVAISSAAGVGQNNERAEHCLPPIDFHIPQASASDDTWPMYRYDAGNTGCSPNTAPFTNHVSWKQQIGSNIYQSTPIVYGEKVYICTNWALDDFDKGENAARAPSRIEALQTFLSNQNTDSTGLYCLDAYSGEQLWYQYLVAPSNPAIVDGNVYVTDLDTSSYYSSLYCLDAETGALIWQKPLGVLVLSSTIYANDKIYLGCLDINTYYSSVRCYDLTGAFVWSYMLPANEMIWFSAPAVHGEYICFITSGMYYYFTGNIYCLNALTGQYRWKHPIFSFGMYMYKTQSPVCSNGKVFCVDFDFYTYYGTLRCYDLASGGLSWNHPLGMAISMATPAVSEDSVFITASDLYSYNNYLFRVHIENGTLQWKSLLFSASSFLVGSPICCANKVIISPGSFYGYSNELLCCDVETGVLDWTFQLDEASLGEASIGDEYVYMVDYTGKVYAFHDVLKIQAVFGGLLGVNALIKNTGEVSLTNITWRIYATGGALEMINRETTGSIAELQAGRGTIVRLIPLIGVGKLHISVSVSMPGMNVIKATKDALILGTIVFVIKPFNPV